MNGATGRTTTIRVVNCDWRNSPGAWLGSSGQAASGRPEIALPSVEAGCFFSGLQQSALASVAQALSLPVQQWLPKPVEQQNAQPKPLSQSVKSTTARQLIGFIPNCKGAFISDQVEYMLTLFY